MCCLCVRAVAVCTLVSFLGNALAEEKSSQALSGEGFLSAPKDWRELVLPARIKALDMVVDQTKGNYEKLRTWQGTYRVHLKQYLPKGFAREHLSTGGVAGETSALWQEFDFTLRFAIEMASDSLYRSKETSRMRWIRDGSNETITIPNTSPVDERSIVTPEHYLHFDPKSIWPGFANVPDHPEARNKHTAFRDIRNLADRQVGGDLPDPRMFFSLTGGMNFDKQIGRLLQAMKGDMGDDLKKKSNELLSVYEATGSGGAWYRLDEMFISGPNSGTTISAYMTAIFSPAAGFNPVSLTMAKDKAGEHPERLILWRWKMFDGIFVPEKVKESIYSEDTGKLVYQREMDLQECSINGTIEPSRFSYKGLGLKDGDLVMDNIDKACYIIKGEKPKKLANYGEKYTPPGLGFGAHLPQWKLALCSVLLILLIVIFIARQYRKRRRLT